LDKRALLIRKISKDHNDGMMSEASYQTGLEDQASVFSNNGEGRKFNSDSGFESLDPVYEDLNSGDEDEVLLDVNKNKKPKDQLYMDFFTKYTELFVSEQQ